MKNNIKTFDLLTGKFKANRQTCSMKNRHKHMLSFFNKKKNFTSLNIFVQYFKAKKIPSYNRRKKKKKQFTPQILHHFFDCRWHQVFLLLCQFQQCLRFSVVFRLQHFLQRYLIFQFLQCPKHNLWL